MFKIQPLKRVARLAQRQVERQIEGVRVLHRMHGGTRCHVGHGRRNRHAWHGMQATLLFHWHQYRAQRDRGRTCGFLTACQALLHRLQQFLQRDRLLEEIHRADPGCLDCGVDRRVAGHHDHRHRQQGVALPFLEQSDAVGIGHPDIEQYQIRRASRADLACLLRVFGGLYRMSFVAQNF